MEDRRTTRLSGRAPAKAIGHRRPQVKHMATMFAGRALLLTRIVLVRYPFFLSVYVWLVHTHAFSLISRGVWPRCLLPSMMTVAPAGREYRPMLLLQAVDVRAKRPKRHNFELKDMNASASVLMLWAGTLLRSVCALQPARPHRPRGLSVLGSNGSWRRVDCVPTFCARVARRVAR